MADYDLRYPLDYRFGQLDVAITNLDTTLTSTAFQTWPVDLSPEKYVPMVLADDARGVYEIVWVTGHASNANTVTVVRGQENTAQVGWSQGTPWRVAPTVRDGQVPLSLGERPSDAHVGMRSVDPDGPIAVQYTGQQGWQPVVVGDPAGMAPALLGNTAPPADMHPMIKAFHVQGVIDGTGSIHDHPFPGGPFPNGVAAVTCTQLYTGSINWDGWVRVSVINRDRATYQCYQHTGGVGASGATVNFSVIAIGY